MLRKVHQKALPADVRMLYTSGVRLVTNDLMFAVQSHVRNVRGRIRSRAQDDLAERLTEFGNNGEWARQKAIELAQIIFQNKGAPTGGTPGEWRSIEFECVFKDRASKDAFVLACRAAGLAKMTTVKTDGSVRQNERDTKGEPAEIVFSYCRGDEASVEKFCKVLAGRAYTNKSCGTHVHFDMRGKSEADVKLAGGRLARYVPILKRMMPESRRSNQYCKDIVNGMGERGSRYAAVNLHSYGRHGTLEVRLHSGTINAKKILNWIKICETIMSKRTKAETEIKDCAALADLYGMDADLKAYMIEREKEFSAAHLDEREEVPVAVAV